MNKVYPEYENRIAGYAYNSNKRKMPSKRQVKDFWGDWLVEIGKFDSHRELNERGTDYCFKCGFDLFTIRAHILPRCEGGSDTASNIHLLCDRCHVNSEELSEKAYFDWFAK